MLRSVLALASIVVLTFLCGGAATVLSLLHPRGDWIIRLGKIWAGGICACAGVRVEARCTENVPKNGSAILISNHQSNFDILALILTMPRPFRVVAKRFLFYIPIFGWSLYFGGMIPIDREKRARAIQSLDKAAALVRAGKPVLLFAEGTRSTDGKLLPFKKGAFVIALKAGVPIVPVSVSGGLQVLPKGSLRVRQGRVIVRYGPQIPVEGYSLDAKEDLMKRVREAVLEGLEGIDPPTHHREDPGASANAETAAP